ncbi:MULTISPECIES: hypothetical protein [Corallincola]|uniref:hypothetical protein n=1 Tax=Corallincola TaxID=1775176 RepID=UPI00131416A4|nr:MULTISPECIES: hypothetical protein [Corallincola]
MDIISKISYSLLAVMLISVVAALVVAAPEDNPDPANGVTLKVLYVLVNVLALYFIWF